MATKIQVRRDTAANWTANDPTLSDGEIGFETDTGLFKIGKSNTAWTSLDYAQVAGPDGPGYAYNIPRSQDDPSFSYTDNIDFQNMNIGQYVSLYKNQPGAYAVGDRVRVVFSNPDAWIEGWVTAVFKDFGGYIQVVTDDWNKSYTSSESQADAKISIIAEPSRSYQLRRRVWKNGNLTYDNSTFNFTTEKIWELSAFHMTAEYSLFEDGDWIKAEFVDFDGTYGDKYKVYSDTWFEGIVYSNYSGSFQVRITNYSNPNSFSGNEFKTSKIPARKATYDLPIYVYGAGDSDLGSLAYNNPPFAEGGIGMTDQLLYGDVGLYQVGQQIRLQYADFGESIPGSYAICEITGIQKRISGTQEEALVVTVLDVNAPTGASGISSYSLHAPDGVQGPGYEITWDGNIHAYPQDPSWLWEQGQTTWKAGDQYDIPGDFTNTAYKVGDYVRYYFQYSTGNYDDEINSWIEGWVTDINTAGATIRVQRWANTDWLNVLSNIPPNTRTTYAHFEPGYNFDTYLSQNTYAVLNDPLNYDYLSDQIQNDPYFNFTLSGHLGSYKAGDYVIVSSKSNPLIKFTAYLVHTGLAGINSYVSNFYPIEILSWDGETDAPIEDWTLSPIAPPEVGYNFPFPLPNPSVATSDTPAYFPPAAFAALEEPTYPLSVGDVIQVRGVTGLYEVGDKVKAYDPYDKDSQFYGEVYSLGSASNEWVSEIIVKDPSVFAGSELSYHPYKIALEERKALFVPETITPVFDFGNSYTYSLSKEDAGRTILGNQGGQAYIIVDGSMQVPVGTQITVLSIAGNPLTIGPAYFTETDTITSGYVTIDQYTAATLVRTSFGWVIVGKFSSAVASIGG
jgi:hypothetical protein